tara:strand:+ start:18028 stop:19050 length:1023 start_codon:yes stop_codon:yes gene_type:complete
VIKILKITSLPTNANPNSGLHVIESSPKKKNFNVNYIKINSGKISKKYKNLNFFQLKNHFKIFQIIRIARNFRPDIISVHSYKYFLIPAILKFISRKKVKFLYTFHGQDKRLINNSRFIYKLFKVLYNKLLTLDFMLSKKFEINFFPNGYNVIQNKKNKKNNSSYFDILYPASFKDVKNHNSFIHFANKFFKKIPLKVRVFFAGDGELKNKYMDICKKIENSNLEFIFLGVISPEELNKYYKDCSICVLPSKNEAFSKVVVECIQNDILLITTKVGSNEYVLGKDYKYFVSKKLDVNDFNILMNAYKNFSDFKYARPNISSWNSIRNNYANFYLKIIQET